MKKKIKAYEGSHSPVRNNANLIKQQNLGSSADGGYQHTNLANVKLRTPYQRTDAFNPNAVQGQVMTNHHIDTGHKGQNRRLMD